MTGKVCNIVGTLLILVIILISAPFFIPRIMGIQSYAVLTDSMEPVYPKGSVVYVKAFIPEEIQTGDVITFSMEKDSEAVTTHRVEEIDIDNKVLVTKGDANAQSDAQKVSFSRVIGKVVFTIPIIGNFALFIQSTLGKLTELVILIIGAALWYVGSLISKKID